MQRGNTPLMEAAQAGHVNVVSQLVNAGAALNVVNKDGQTPLHFAATHGEDEMLALVVKAKAKKLPKEKPKRKEGEEEEEEEDSVPDETAMMQEEDANFIDWDAKNKVRLLTCLYKVWEE
jgi:ankyrin repeat protein